jgi:hypothetical protein
MHLLLVAVALGEPIPFKAAAAVVVEFLGVGLFLNQLALSVQVVLLVERVATQDLDTLLLVAVIAVL